MNQVDSQAIKDSIEQVVTKIAQSVYGQDEATRLLASAFLAGGHVLLEGPPGIAKTLLARRFAQVVGLTFNRIQFTPDLMPSDITGVSVFDQATASFRFVPGPLLADIVLADEINRTPPKTQSALLQAMEERFITVDGNQYVLGDFFFVIATQNPIEHEGTYPLPEAQLDRFFIKVPMSYPAASDEVALIERLSSDPSPNYTNAAIDADSLLTEEHLIHIRSALYRVTLSSAIADYIQRIAQSTRRHPDIILGASPRAALHLALAAKTNAVLDGRDYVVPDDVQAMVKYVLTHRLVLQPDIVLMSKRADDILTAILKETYVPERI